MLTNLKKRVERFEEKQPYAYKSDLRERIARYRHILENLYSRNQRAVRIFEYIFLFFLVFLVVAYVFFHFDLICTEPTSARYMLSALVQCQAAIVAIVVSLTLIAVQLTASAYSPRVIRIFKDNPDMWILLSLYGFSIFFGLFVLKMIRGVGDTNQFLILDSTLEACIITVYAIGISTFVILFMYLCNTINLLEPANIIERLAIKITKDKFLKSEDDPIRPIMDIVCGSIVKYDYETTRVGLKAVNNQVLEIIDPEIEEDISTSFCEHLEEVCRLTISRKDVVTTVKVIGFLRSFGRSTTEKGFENATMHAALYLGRVGRTAAKKELEDVAGYAAVYLGDVGIIAAENELKDATMQAAKSLDVVGRTAAKKELEDATIQAAKSLGVVGRTAAEKELEDATIQAAKSLGVVGRTAAEKELEDATIQAAKSLGVVGRTAAEKELEDATIQAAKSLGDVGIIAAENKLEDATMQAANSLGVVGRTAAKKELEDATMQAVNSLGVVGRTAAEKELKDVAGYAAVFLCDVGTTAAKKELKDVVGYAAVFLCEVGRTAAEKELEDATIQAAKSLAKLTILSKENVETGILIYKSKFKIQEAVDYNFFEKFIRIYKQKFEELLTR